MVKYHLLFSFMVRHMVIHLAVINTFNLELQGN